MKKTHTSDRARRLERHSTARLKAAAPKLLQMLKHALAFIEHVHAHGDEPISEIDTISQATDGGPSMECDLKGIRAAIARCGREVR